MLLGVPFDQGQGFNDRTGKPAVVDGKPEEDEEKFLIFLRLGTPVMVTV